MLGMLAGVIHAMAEEDITNGKKIRLGLMTYDRMLHRDCDLMGMAGGTSRSRLLILRLEETTITTTKIPCAAWWFARRSGSRNGKTGYGGLVTRSILRPLSTMQNACGVQSYEYGMS